ncbi:unnamed protein product [Callosobruchus maculatus]|uniref:Uncharacterized protein n=1 Tax=Callosobruchus maculatus TaxID=64391 RepID=A0A653DDA3_CALMS|nr:unnamed protein product [Callosobruchus maculatus]
MSVYQMQCILMDAAQIGGTAVRLRAVPAGAAHPVRASPHGLLLQRLPGGRAYRRRPHSGRPARSGARPVRADRPAGGSGRAGDAERPLRRGGRAPAAGLLQAGRQSDARWCGRWWCGQHAIGSMYIET